MPELRVYDPGLSPLPMQNPYSKLILGVKSLSTGFQNVCCTYYDKFSAKYCCENILPPSKESINNLRKSILRSQNILINIIPLMQKKSDLKFLSRQLWCSRGFHTPYPTIRLILCLMLDTGLKFMLYHHDPHQWPWGQGHRLWNFKLKSLVKVSSEALAGSCSYFAWCKYWSEDLCCTIVTHINDLEVKVTDFEILS